MRLSALRLPRLLRGMAKSLCWVVVSKARARMRRENDFIFHPPLMGRVALRVVYPPRPYRAPRQNLHEDIL
jgi:hypothetical protein